MIYLLLDICSTSSGLKIMYLLKILMNFICIAVPIILLVVLMLDFTKAITKRDEDAMLVMKKKAVPKLIAAIVVFLVPTIVSLLMSIIGVEKYHDCFANVTMDEVKQLESEEKENRNNTKTNSNSTGASSSSNSSNTSSGSNNNSGSSNFVNGGATSSNNNTNTNINKNPEYTSSNSHTNSINGVKYMIYNQCREPWGSKMFSYSRNTTVCAEGCPIISAAVVVSAADSSITPLEAYNVNVSDMPVVTIEKLAGEYFEKKSTDYPLSNYHSYAYCNREFKDKSAKNIAKLLTDGSVIIMRRQLYPATNDGNHWMALIDVYPNTIDAQENANQIQVFVGNSMENGDTPTTRAGWFDINDIVINPQEVFVCTPTEKLINKFK